MDKVLRGFEKATVLRSNSGCMLIAWLEEGDELRLCIRQYMESHPEKTFRLSIEEAKKLAVMIGEI